MRLLPLLTAALWPAAALAQAPASVCASAPAYWGCYQPIGTPDPANTVPVATPAGPREVTLGQILSAAAGASGQFYADSGAAVQRFGDRLFLGAAADNPGKANRDALPRDWLSTTMGATSIGAYAVWGAQGASLARYGSIGWLAGSRTSDAQANKGKLGYTPSSIGIASWAIDDDTTSPRTTTAYAYYGEVWHLPGVGYQPSFAMELEAVDIGGGPLGSSTSYHPNTGGGAVGIQLGAGGGQTQQTWDAAAGLIFVNNPARFQNGVLFGADALTGVTSSPTDTGYAPAIRMARNQAVQWDTPETRATVQGVDFGLFIRSTVAHAVNATRWEAQDSGVVLSNASGQQLFAVSTAGQAVNSLYVQPGSVPGAAAGLYVAVGAGGNGNLGLFPATGGELQLTSPVTAAGSTLAANNTPTGWLHINVNGQDLRLPLFTAAQAGG